MAVGEKNWVRHWEVHVRMDLSKIMNIQDGFLQSKADLLLDRELINSITPNTVRQKIRASILSKIRLNEDKRSGNRLWTPHPGVAGHGVPVRA